MPGSAHHLLSKDRSPPVMSMDKTRVAVFWDYENCPPPSSLPGYAIVENIRRVAHTFGSITMFKAYLELSENTTEKAIKLRSELQSSGVSLTDCPHNGRKEVADKMILVDMLAFALDNPAPAVIMLISGDRDFVYCLSVLRLRQYTVALIVPKQGADITLKSQANTVLEWQYDVLNPHDETLKALEQAEAFQTSLTGSTGGPSQGRVVPRIPTPLSPGLSGQRRSTSLPFPISVPTTDTESNPLAPPPQFFDLLIETLEKWRLEGDARPKWSRLGMELRHRNPLLYNRAGVSSLKQYIGLAELAGIVTAGRPSLGNEWISLNEPYQGRTYE